MKLTERLRVHYNMTADEIAEEAADRIERLEEALRDLIVLADWAMADANRDCGEYDRVGELREARAALEE